jgi:hypothetical protein
VQGFVRVPLNDLDAVRQVAANNRNVVAVFIEPIQGEGGINVARLEYLRGLKEICDRQEWLFMSDEVQCGLGRTGKWFVYQHAGFLPDVVPLAKGLGSGVPVGACVTGGRRQRRVQARQSRLDVRRQPARDDRRGHHDRHDARRGPARECGEGRRCDPRWARRGARRNRRRDRGARAGDR